MKLFQQFAYSVGVACIAILLFPYSARAQGVDDFVFIAYESHMRLTRDDPQGLLEVTEYMEVDFSGQNRGILRAIPSTYKGNDLELQVLSVSRDGTAEQYSTYTENDNYVLHIGNPSVYITGVHTYEITYRVENVITFYDEHDEFYWDINGDQWSQPFLNTSVDITTEAPIAEGKTTCYTGRFGSSDSYCDIEQTANAVTSTTTNELAPNETLSIVVGFEKGFFTPMSFWERHADALKALPIITLFILMVFIAYRRWTRVGKDLPGRGVVAPFYGRPKDVSVMLASYVYRQGFNTKDITASIIDLAIKGNVKIIEKNKKSHTLELLYKDYSQLKPDEIMLLKVLFPTQTAGDTISLSKSQKALYSSVGSLSKKLDELSRQHNYFDVAPSRSFSTQTAPLILTGILTILCIVLPIGDIKLYVIPAGIIATLMIIVLGLLMKRRSQKGVALKEHLDGLKLYLEKAEKNRIKMQDAVAAPLAKNTDTTQPEWTREFFEKLLPFAVVFGVDSSWAKAFEGVYQQPPDWYQGEWKTFKTAYLVSGLQRATAHTASSFTAPSSSSSSGFSGGGFSGGGGGGGGGGGW